jgi:ATP-dependent RNA helicase SUPV3L1/SUV3
LSVALRARVLERLNRWFDRLVESKLGPLRGIRKLADDPGTPPAMRAFASQLVAAAGVMERQAIESNLRELGQGERRQLTRAGIVIGALDIFHPAMLKPELTRIRLALLAIHGGNLMPLVPANAPAVIRKPSPEAGAGARKAGYRRAGFPSAP